MGPYRSMLNAVGIMHFSSHLTLSGEEVAEPTGPEKQTVGFLLKHVVEECNFHQIGEQQQ